MNNVFGWGLPPGVSQNDIDGSYGANIDDPETKRCPNCNSWAFNQEWMGPVKEQHAECRGVLSEDGVTLCGEYHAHEKHQYVSWYYYDVRWLCGVCQHSIVTQE